MSASNLASPAAVPSGEPASLRRHSWLFLALGLVSIVVGVLAIGAPHFWTERFVVVIGVLLLITGVTEVIHAVMVRSLPGFAMHLLAAALYLFVGVFVLEAPDRAAVVLTLVLAAFFFVGGALRIIFSRVERFPGWQWALFNGLVDLLLGVLIWRGWPETSLWVIGLFVGIELIFHGWSWVVLALTARAYGPARSA
jgi:uncharacterized membrane protein HdeD (DUF308 family)